MIEIHFLQRQDVRVEDADTAAQSVEMDAVADGAYGLAAVALEYLRDDALAAAVRADFEASGGLVDVPALFG